MGNKLALDLETNDNRIEERELKTLPKPKLQREFVLSLIKEYGVAEIHCPLSSKEILEHNDKESPINATWEGSLEAPIYLGYPFLYMERTYDNLDSQDPEKIIHQERKVLDLGIPLIILYWSSDHDCFVCVRGDVYAS